MTYYLIYMAIGITLFISDMKDFKEYFNKHKNMKDLKATSPNDHAAACIVAAFFEIALWPIWMTIWLISRVVRIFHKKANEQNNEPFTVQNRVGLGTHHVRFEVVREGRGVLGSG